MKKLALWVIRVYQRLISPNKGFRCAYAAHTGHASCSVLGYRAIRRFGVLGGMSVLDARLHKCGVAHRRYRPARSKILASQAGNCEGDDLECSGSDSGCSDLDVDSPCDRGARKKTKKGRKQDQDVVLPPRRAA